MTYKEILESGDLYMRLFAERTDPELMAMGQFMVARWPEIRTVLEKASKDV